MQTTRVSARKTRTVAAFLTAAALVASAERAPAQQMGIGGPPDPAQCALIKDPVKSAQCLDTLMNASIAKSKERMAAANDRIAKSDGEIAAAAALRPCLLYLKAKKDGGATLPPVTADNACKVAASLGMPGGPR